MGMETFTTLKKVGMEFRQFERTHSRALSEILTRLCFHYLPSDHKKIIPEYKIGDVIQKIANMLLDFVETGMKHQHPN